MGILEFILARIEDDEVLAGAAADAMPTMAVIPQVDYRDAIAEFVGRWNPWRVMSLCVLQRHCVLAHRPIRDEFGGMICSTCDDRRGHSGWPCRPLKLIANEWAEHADFRPEWGAERRPRLVAI